MRVMHECLNVLRGLLSQDVEPKLASKSCKARIATKRTRCQQEDEGREVSISLVESGSSEKPAKHFAALRGKGSTTTCTCFVNNIATSYRQSGVWRNGSASDSRSEGWEFESLCPHFVWLCITPVHMQPWGIRFANS